MMSLSEERISVCFSCSGKFGFYLFMRKHEQNFFFFFFFLLILYSIKELTDV
jgi:hypothetical protein